MEKNQLEKTKICLVNPRLEGPYPPLGLAYLASYLRKYGQNNYEIKIIDGNCVNNVINDILRFNPSIAGFTALSPQIKDTVNLSAFLRSKRPDIFQIIGGVHVSSEPEQTLKKGSFDLAVIGEGEETFKDIVDVLIQNGKDKSFYSNINGVAFLDNAKLTVNPQREEIGILDAVPAPDRSLLNMRNYLSNYLIIRGLSGDRITTIHTSRGCPYDCIFCSCGIVFKKVRYFSVDYVISEIKELISKYRVRGLFFTDDTFIINKQRVGELCSRFINEGLNRKLKWEVQGRANLIDWQDLSLLKLMKEAGCVQIDYGFETGSDKILKFLKKKDVSVDFNKRAIEVTKAAGLNVMGTFMVGIPGETENDLELTKRFIEENNKKIDNFQVFIATPYPGAELYRICKENKIVEDNYFDQLLKQEDKDFLGLYTDTVPYENVMMIQKLLNKLALQKIRLNDKIHWFLFNFIKNPFKAIKKIYFALC